jgi:hypothetical protein
VAGEAVAYRIRWEGDLPSQGTVLWAVEVSDGAESLVLGHERHRATFVTQYVEDPATRRRVEADEDADLADGEITVRLPANLVGVAADWPSWTAYIVADGHELSRQVVPQT